MSGERTFSAFVGERRVATGDVRSMLAQVVEYRDGEPDAQPLIFDEATGRQVDFDLRGSADEVLARLALHPLFAADTAASGTTLSRPTAGRPRLGVVSREVTLLPRHWDWLAEQPSGVSAALRKLVEQALRHQPGAERARLALVAAGRFMTAMAGNRPNYEEASRALYAGDTARLADLIATWPLDLREFILRLAAQAETLAATASCE